MKEETIEKFYCYGAVSLTLCKNFYHHAYYYYFYFININVILSQMLIILYFLILLIFLNITYNRSTAALVYVNNIILDRSSIIEIENLINLFKIKNLCYLTFS